MTTVRLSVLFFALAVGFPVTAAPPSTSIQADGRIEGSQDSYPGEDWMQYADVADAPRLVRAAPGVRNESPVYALSAAQLTNYLCEIERDSGRKIVVADSDGALTIESWAGTSRLWPESETRFITGDSKDPVIFELTEDGRVRRVWSEELC